MRCKKCFDCYLEYILLYQPGNEQPSFIHVWDLSNENSELVQKIELGNDLLPNMVLEPKYFCFNCNSLLPKALPGKKYDEFVKSYKGE